ncbi:phosphomevalonate kinase [Lactobacillaceae bacterium L1_55_11]|nr:phosphomevalonate kinase [Lactobacillaceae bacterium L1_55_11]
MTKQPLSIYSPGKLFLAGEYAVTKTGQSAIVAAVDRGLTFTISASPDANFQLSSSSIVADWTFNGGQDYAIEGPWAFVRASLKILQTYLALEKRALLSPFHLTIESQLLAANGQKLGLGSSAAVVAGTINVLDAYFDLQLDQLKRFKLAALAHHYVQGNGSLADVATSITGGVIAYQGTDLAQLMQPYHHQINQDLVSLVNRDWPDLAIHQLPWPSDWRLSLVATHQSADTKKALSRVQLAPDFYQDSQKIVMVAQAAIAGQDYSQLRNALATNQSLLRENLPAEYLTPRLTQFLAGLTIHHLAGKVSGAGFGDNGFAISDGHPLSPDLVQTWTSAGLNVSTLNIVPSQLKFPE